MRTSLAAVAIAVALACSLAGCGRTGAPSSSGDGAPESASTASASTTSASTAPATGLVGGRWAVEGADADATVVFQSRSITLTIGSAASTFAWDAQGDQVLITRATLALAGGPTASWLTATTRVERTGSGWTLHDASGATTARLVPADDSNPLPTPADAPPTPGPGVSDMPASTLLGTWHLAGHPTTAIAFTATRWKSAASCETGASGGAGAYRVLPGGGLLVTRTASQMFGCPIGRDDDRVRAPAIAGIDRATSFLVDGSTLTLFDRTGKAIGSLVR